MRTYTDSSTVTHNEDGSWTTKEEYTQYPASTKEKALAWTALGVIGVAPILVIVAIDKVDAWAVKRAARKAEAEKKN